MSKKTFRSVVAAASLVVGMSGACSAAASVQTAIWDPHPIDPQRCHNQEGPPPTPPDPSGYCDVEVRLTSMKFETGQGATEGKGEITGFFDVTEAGSWTTGAVAPEQEYSVGHREGMNLDLGTYRIQVGETRQVEVCGWFWEQDGGGVNGGSDSARACTTLPLHCDAQTGQEPFEPEIGPADFHGEKVSLGSMSAQISVSAADADMDNIPNDDDFTPDMCDEELKGTGGIALLLYVHYDDNGLITLGQSLWTNLSQVYSAYDYVVLVADNETSNPGNTSGAAWSGADRVFRPTRAGLLDAMQHLTSEHYRFDTFVHAHGYKNGALDSEFETWDADDKAEEAAGEEDDEDDLISGDWLVTATHPDLIGTAEGGIPIVAWWSTTCIALRQIDAWITRGAVTASGAEDVQFFPNAWGEFADNWIGGQTYVSAVNDSLTPLVVARAQTLINGQGSVHPWWCVGVDTETGDPLTVLGGSPCAHDFFVDDDGSGPTGGPDEAAYNIWEVYDDTQTGAANMEISSERSFAGNMMITFGAANHTWP